mmetsp:Transcript_4024/g.10183  ORF Transcript_4024/g.10183 Transcript_4024/m.10183 type:complete len:208 (+) Transcript_4024:972-1595(+)
MASPSARACSARKSSATTRSESMKTTTPPRACATPMFRAAAAPRFVPPATSRTRAHAPLATRDRTAATVSSVDPSSTTTTSNDRTAQAEAEVEESRRCLSSASRHFVRIGSRLYVGMTTLQWDRDLVGSPPSFPCHSTAEEEEVEGSPAPPSEPLARARRDPSVTLQVDKGGARGGRSGRREKRRPRGGRARIRAPACVEVGCPRPH